MIDLEIEELVDQLALPRAEAFALEFSKMLVFGLGDPEPMRRRLETRLKTRIDQVDRACKLTPEQKAKLNVAGRGDMKRVFARMDELSELLTAPELEVRRRKELLLEFARKRQEITETDMLRRRFAVRQSLEEHTDAKSSTRCVKKPPSRPRLRSTRRRSAGRSAAWTPGCN